MAGAKELKARMGGVRETKQITSAMYLIASTKLRHARADLEKTRPYFDALRAEMTRLFRVSGDAKNRWLAGPHGETRTAGVRGVLAITGDKGLCGGYNMNVIRRAEALMKEAPDAKLYVVGEYGRHYFQSHRTNMEEDFRFSASEPSLDAARDICTRLLQNYGDKELNEIVLVYTDMHGAAGSEVVSARLLPLERETVGTGETGAGYEFFPSLDEVIETVLHSYLSGYIYSAMVDSLCAEQNARVNAMDAASRNADELLSSLSLQLNRERQSSITQEITEISAGAKAQKRKKEGSLV